MSTSTGQRPGPGAAWSAQDLSDILESARRHNRRNQVTGMLLCYQDQFLQVLEGTSAAVGETYGRIVQDPRHAHVFKMDEIRVDQRHFADWSMGFQALDGIWIAQHKDLQDVFMTSPSQIALRAHRGTAAAVLQLFHRGAFLLR